MANVDTARASTASGTFGRPPAPASFARTPGRRFLPHWPQHRLFVRADGHSRLFSERADGRRRDWKRQRDGVGASKPRHWARVLRWSARNTRRKRAPNSGIHGRLLDTSFANSTSSGLPRQIFHHRHQKDICTFEMANQSEGMEPFMYLLSFNLWLSVFFYIT